MSSTNSFPNSSLSLIEAILWFPIGTMWRDSIDGVCTVDSELCYRENMVFGYTVAGKEVQYQMGWCVGIWHPQDNPGAELAPSPHWVRRTGQ